MPDHYHTIQVWPSGRLYHYDGDPFAQTIGLYPRFDRRLRVGGHGEQPARWRPGRYDEWRQIRIELTAGRYLDRDILCCDSMLVDDLLKAEHDGFSWDNVENVYTDPSDWTYEQCREWLDERGISIDGDDVDALIDQIRDEAEPAEVYEWWRVSAWLCDRLNEISEVVLDNGYGHWWGRQGTGQALIMDGTLQQIAAQYERT